MMEVSTEDSTAGKLIKLLPGFRFRPTDEELVVHYLSKKAAAHTFPIPIIAELDLYKFDPWDLPRQAIFGEQEWYFFSPRDRKYPNGVRPNRAAASGFWKATRTDKPILSSVGNVQKLVAVKKVLVFFIGKAVPKGRKTNWIMHEYRLTDSAGKPSYAKQKGSIRLDDWVLCRIYKRNVGSAEQKLIQSPEHLSSYSYGMFQDAAEDHQKSLDDILALVPDIDNSKVFLPRFSYLRASIEEEDPFAASDRQYSEGKLQYASTESVQQQDIELQYFAKRRHAGEISDCDSTRNLGTQAQHCHKRPPVRDLEGIDIRSIKQRLGNFNSASDELQNTSRYPIFPTNSQSINHTSEISYSTADPSILQYLSSHTNPESENSRFFVN